MSVCDLKKISPPLSEKKSSHDLNSVRFFVLFFFNVEIRFCFFLLYILIFYIYKKINNLLFSILSYTSFVINLSSRPVWFFSTFFLPPAIKHSENYKFGSFLFYRVHRIDFRGPSTLLDLL